MQELQAGERTGVLGLGAGAGARLVLRVRGARVAEDLPPGARVWAVLVGPGARVLDSGPLPGYRDGEGGLASGESGVPGVVVRPELLYGETHRVCAVLTWTGRTGPLTLEVRVDGGVAARAALPVREAETEGGGAMLLASVYRRGPGTRLWVHAERVRGASSVETLFELPEGALREAASPALSPAPPAVVRPSPVPPPASAAPEVPPPSVSSALLRLREAWAVLTGTPREEPPRAPTPLAPPEREVERNGDAPPPRTARALADLEARLAALREVQDEEERVRRTEGLLLSPEDARRRARLSALEDTLARVQSEAAALARRRRQVRRVGGPEAVNAPEIVAVENAIEETVQALSRALDAEARRLVDGPLAESQRRLSGEARFLDDLDAEEEHRLDL